MWWAVLAQEWELLVSLEHLMDLLDVISKGCDHCEMLLSKLCSNRITLKQPLKALQQLEGGCQSSAVIKGLQNTNIYWLN